MAAVMATMSPGCEDDGVEVCVCVCVCKVSPHSHCLLARYGLLSHTTKPHGLLRQTTIDSTIAIGAPTPTATAVTKYTRVLLVGWK